MSGPSNPHRFCSCLAQAMPAGPSSRVHRVGKGGVYVRRRSTFIGDATDQDKAPVAIAAIDDAFVGVDFEPYARVAERRIGEAVAGAVTGDAGLGSSEEPTSELQSLTPISYAVFCLQKKQNTITT